ncbi:2399_t:CDS:2 [Funneliformis caledonium]|uniref:2399_t:CDS:1 n=1 Tax=Funneliformis caledonium TaxID=1117310 RepID=A0A9N9DFS0_9GLOM|nr:2399_t:CDS:2 [Funneliformis caledonium]
MKVFNNLLVINSTLCTKHGDYSGYSMSASNEFNSKDVWGYSDFSLLSFESLYIETKLLTMCRPCRDSNFAILFLMTLAKMAIKPLSDKEIKDNIGDLKKKLAGSTTSHAKEIPTNL